MEFSKDDLLVMKAACCFARDAVVDVIFEFTEDSNKYPVSVAENACNSLCKLDAVIEKLKKQR